MQEEYITETEEEKGDWKGKISDFLANKYFVPIIVVLIAIIGFSLGRVSGLQERRPEVKILNNAPLTPLLQQEGGTGKTNLGEVKGVSVQNSVTANSGTVVASKNSTKYHYPWCPGAKQISPQNLVTFNSIEEARAAGFTPATNCKGLK
jgi:hypothetical protein